MDHTRRAFLAGAGAGAFAVAGAGCSSLSRDGQPSGEPDDGNRSGNRSGDQVPVESVADAPVPEDPGAHRYATMGAGDAPRVTYFGNWKCPYCAQFSTGLLEEDVLGYVARGELRLRFRALSYGGNGDPFLGPDAPRAGEAGLAVWNVDPASYWAYHERVFANQPDESEQWATTDRLVSFAEAAGVSDPGAVRTAIEEDTYDAPVRANTEAAVEAGVRGTPSLVADGEVVNPVADPESARTLLSELASQ
ncbi:MAG: DsbA family protein [Halobacteriaceae archaeon]